MTPDTDLIARHIAHCKHVGLAATTIAGRASFLDRFAAFVHALPHSPKLLAVTTEDLHAWQRSIAHIGRDGRRGLVIHARAFYRWAARLELVEPRLVDDLVVPKIPRRLPRPIPETDLALALNDPPARIRPWLLLACCAGLRCCEIAILRGEDIDYGGQRLHLVGKGGKERVVPIGSDLTEYLRGLSLPRRGWVFPKYSRGKHEPLPGTHVTASQVSHLVGIYRRQLELAGALHTFRHRYLTDVNVDTGNIRLVQELAGHASLSTTQIYTLVTMTDAVDVAERLATRRMRPVDA